MPTIKNADAVRFSRVGGTPLFQFETWSEGVRHESSGLKEVAFDKQQRKILPRLGLKTEIFTQQNP